MLICDILNQIVSLPRLFFSQQEEHQVLIVLRDVLHTVDSLLVFRDVVLLQVLLDWCNVLDWHYSWGRVILVSANLQCVALMISVMVQVKFCPEVPCILNIPLTIWSMVEHTVDIPTCISQQVII